MSRISGVFDQLAEESSAAYIPYICAGDPDIRFTVDLARELCSAGADLLEIGLPFSDPVGDGPTIQEAMGRSLSGGFEIKHLFKTIDTLRKDELMQPIVVMTYFNPVLRYGIERFCKALGDSGVDGILVVDLPLEESEELDVHARRNGLDVIRLVAPNTTDERMKRLISVSSGFVYAVSVPGVTGARTGLPRSALTLLDRLKRECEVPVALGFGISSPSHVSEAMKAGADGIVEGSALIGMYADFLKDPKLAIGLVGRHAREMKMATRPSG